MPIWTLRRRDRVNNGAVGCPSGNVYNVDANACISVTDEQDVAALLEIGRPPKFMREGGKDTPGFWQLVAVDGEEVPDYVAEASAAEAAAAAVPADPVAQRLFKPQQPAPDPDLAKEVSIAADENVSAAAGPASTVGGSNWRAARETAVDKATDANRCQAVKVNGEQCKGRAVNGEEFCALHRKKK